HFAYTFVVLSCIVCIYIFCYFAQYTQCVLHKRSSVKLLYMLVSKFRKEQQDRITFNNAQTRPSSPFSSFIVNIYTQQVLLYVCSTCTAVHIYMYICIYV